jgi:hypothetical protein
MSTLVAGISLIAIACVAGKAPPGLDGEGPLLPAIAEITEMRADVYSSFQALPDFYNFVVPREHYEHVLAFLRPAKKTSFPEGGLPEVGRITVTAKNYGTRTIVFYDSGKRATLMFTSGAIGYERQGRQAINGLTLDGTIRRLIEDAEKKPK